MTKLAAYPSPGRGAWSLRGGLLPVRPGSTNKAGYYRLAQPTMGEKWIGLAHTQGDTSHDARVVHLAVEQIQIMLGFEEADIDGIFGPRTHQKVMALQARCGLKADGIVGPSTMRAGLTPLLQDLAARNGIPVAVLGGLIVNESNLDPAAVGVNGADHGIAQINLDVHPLSVQEAIDIEKALEFTVRDLSSIVARWQGKTSADPYDIAIANHNSPALAQIWARKGEAPHVVGRVFQIAEYVQRVRTSW